MKKKILICCKLSSKSCWRMTRHSPINTLTHQLLHSGQHSFRLSDPFTGRATWLVSYGIAFWRMGLDGGLGASRIHLNVERWRVCEAWFCPGMAGVDSAGLGEVLQNVLARFPDRDKGRLVGVR
jgi:hypothetical protein